MKNLARLFGIAVLVVAIGLLVTACPTDDGDNGGGGGIPVSSAPLGETLTLSGQVYTMNIDDNDHTVTFTPIQDDLSVNSGGLGGSGSVTGGLLSFTIGTPNALEENDSIFINPADTRSAALEVLKITSNANYNSLERMNSAVTTSGTSWTQTSEGVSYVYVDRDATFTGPEISGSENGATYTTSAVNMILKKGWNAMYYKGVATSTQSGYSENYSISAANPSHLRWVVKWVYD